MDEAQFREWPFGDRRPDEAVITTRQVLDGAPVLVVALDEEGWSFLCGTTDDVADGRVVGLGETLLRDPTLAGVGDLPLGGSARRAGREHPWIRSDHDQRPGGRPGTRPKRRRIWDR